MTLLCELPYRCANIDEKGNVYPCCSGYCNGFSFGNIFYEKEFENIWNGDRAKEFRKQFVEQKYNYCNLNVCIPHRSEDNTIALTETSEKRPSSVLLGYDRTCNVKCIFCNPEHNNYSKKFIENEEWYIDLLKDVSQVNVSCNGEALASEHSRNLIKKIVEVYPNIKFDILTNGLLFNEINLNELGILNKLSNVGISFHSLNKETYNKLVKNSDFDEVMKNVKYAIYLRKQNIIKNLEFRFVITTYNYKEMVAFAKFAQQNNATAIFMDCIQYNMSDNFYNKINIINSEHKEYNKFVKILKNPIFKENYVVINGALLSLKQVNIFTCLKKKLINALFH
ncbi:MAG: radical SAM protein [Cyanobacteria bacterium SIG29]|nr:radical SAM protein [Cyanobacteria bacterium SIG29]